eukprot:2696879-Ditylum_brightwellii.AAC.1
MKHHANCYFGDDATSDDVPASNAMSIADITPHSNNDHKKIFYNRVRRKNLTGQKPMGQKFLMDPP